MRRLVAPPLLMFGAWKSVWVSRCWHLGQACDISQGGQLKRAEKSSERWRTFLWPRFREPPSAPPRPTSHPPTATNNAHHSLAISTRQIRHIRWRSCACQRPDFVRVVCRGTCVAARVAWHVRRTHQRAGEKRLLIADDAPKGRLEHAMPRGEHTTIIWDSRSDACR